MSKAIKKKPKKTSGNKPDKLSDVVATGKPENKFINELRKKKLGL